MRVRGKSQAAADLAYLKTAPLEQGLRILDLACPDVCRKGHAGLLPKQPGEVIHAEMEVVGHALRGHAVIELLVDVANALVDRLGPVFVTLLLENRLGKVDEHPAVEIEHLRDRACLVCLAGVHIEQGGRFLQGKAARLGGERSLCPGEEAGDNRMVKIVRECAADRGEVLLRCEQGPHAIDVAVAYALEGDALEREAPLLGMLDRSDPPVIHHTRLHV